MAAQTSISISKKGHFHCCHDGFVFAEEKNENVGLPLTAAFKTCTEFYNLVQQMNAINMATHNIQLKLKFLIFTSCFTAVTSYTFGITALPLNC